MIKLNIYKNNTKVKSVYLHNIQEQPTLPLGNLWRKQYFECKEDNHLICFPKL